MKIFTNFFNKCGNLANKVIKLYFNCIKTIFSPKKMNDFYGGIHCNSMKNSSCFSKLSYIPLPETFTVLIDQELVSKKKL
ncbi:MAG: hypothetical protein U0W75_00545 [Buchnera aphidicola (Schlechtendalia chinensis)]